MPLPSANYKNNEEIVFHRGWFDRHQKTLLRFANTSIGRHMLCIDGDKSSIGKNKIIKIEPHAITWQNNDGTFSTEFRTNAKFARRLYYALKPIWQVMHLWDKLVSPVPYLNLGFDTLTKYPDADAETDTVDGDAQRSSVSQIWADILAGAGTTGRSTQLHDTVVGHTGALSSGKWARVARGIFLFNTSSISDTATITAASLSLYGEAKQDGKGLGELDINIYSSNPASNTDIVAADYGSLGTTAFSDTINYADFSVTGYNVFELNASGIAAIAKDGISKFGARMATYDVGGTSPTWGALSVVLFSIYFAEQDGTSNDPKLVVTYTPLGQTITAKARVQKSPLKTIEAKARIKTVANKTLTAKANINSLSHSTGWIPADTSSSFLYDWTDPTNAYSLNNAYTRAATIEEAIIYVYYSNDGWITSSFFKATSQLGMEAISQTLGGYTDMWNDTLTPEQANDPNQFIAVLQSDVGIEQPIQDFSFSTIDIPTDATIIGVEFRLSNMYADDGYIYLDFLEARITYTLPIVSSGTIQARARIEKTSTNTIETKANIAVSSTKTVDAKARIQTSANKSVESKARIIQEKTQTVLAKVCIAQVSEWSEIWSFTILNKISVFNDSFNDNAINDTLWYAWGNDVTPGTIIESVQQLNINTTTGANYYGSESRSYYDLEDSQISVEVINAGDQSIESYEAYPIILERDANNFLEFNIIGNTLSARKRVNSITTIVESDTYSPTNHRWLRIRETSGTTYWETSGNGIDWNIFHSEGTTIALDSFKYIAQAGTWQIEPNTTSLILDNVNWYIGIKTLEARANISKTAESTLTALSRIQVTEDKSIVSQARIQQEENERTVNAKANILSTVSTNVEAKARIQRALIYQVDTKCNIRNTDTQSINAVARIIKTIDETTYAKARIERKESEDIQSKANIKNSYLTEFIAKARIERTEKNDVFALTRIKSQYSQQIEGKANILSTLGQTISALANIKREYYTTISAKANIFSTLNQVLDAKARIQHLEIETPILSRGNIRNVLSATANARARIERGDAKSIDTKADIRNSIRQTMEVKSNIRHGYGQDIDAKANILNSLTASFETKANFLKEFSKTISALANIRNISIASVVSRARIQRTEFRSIDALARIQQAEIEQNISVVANIKGIKDQSLEARAYITTIGGETINAKANIRTTNQSVISTKARIGHTNEYDVEARARVQHQESSEIVARTDIKRTTSQLIQTSADIKQTTEQTVTSKALIVSMVDQTIAAYARIQRIEIKTVQSKADIIRLYSRTIQARARIGDTIATVEVFEVVDSNRMTQGVNVIRPNVDVGEVYSRSAEATQNIDQAKVETKEIIDKSVLSKIGKNEAIINEITGLLLSVNKIGGLAVRINGVKSNHKINEVVITTVDTKDFTPIYPVTIKENPTHEFASTNRVIEARARIT